MRMVTNVLWRGEHKWSEWVCVSWPFSISLYFASLVLYIVLKTMFSFFILWYFLQHCRTVKKKDYPDISQSHTYYLKRAHAHDFDKVLLLLFFFCCLLLLRRIPRWRVEIVIGYIERSKTERHLLTTAWWRWMNKWAGEEERHNYWRMVEQQGNNKKFNSTE